MLAMVFRLAASMVALPTVVLAVPVLRETKLGTVAKALIMPVVDWAERPVVELTAMEGEIQLVVSDSGRGFEVEAANTNRGLGLVSMQERVHLVRGSLHVESEPSKGTKIFAVVPLASGIQSSSDDKGADMPAGIIGDITLRTGQH